MKPPAFKVLAKGNAAASAAAAHAWVAICTLAHPGHAARALDSSGQEHEIEHSHLAATPAFANWPTRLQ